MKEFSYGKGSFPLGDKTYIMGIVNITPDSFSDGGKYLSASSAIAHALTLMEDGADVLDLGACSTKPFSEAVSPEEEQRRLLPVLSELKKLTDIPLSVDTFYTDTARKALEAGADIINDVSGIFSAETAALVKEYNAGYIVMHGGVKLAPSHAENDYPMGVVNDVQMYFDDVTEKLLLAGLEKTHICLDPGFGFMKNTAQNAELLRSLSLLDTNGCALLVGLSRKRFIGELSGDADVSDRLAGTLAANVLAARDGADIIRTHEVKLHKRALALIDRLDK